MPSNIEPGFEPGAEKKLPGVEEEIAAARQTLAEAREMLEEALGKTGEVFDNAPGEVPGSEEAVAP